MLQNNSSQRGAGRRVNLGWVCSALACVLLAAGLGACSSSGAGAQAAPPSTSGAPQTKPVLVEPNASALPRQWWLGPLMWLPVKSFQDSNGDGTGDLRGVIRHLDALRDAGVRGLVLSHLVATAAGDAQAVMDHRRVDPTIGTLEDFDALVQEAHARGIAVMADYVLNHSALEHPHFQQSYADPKNAYRQWYVWSIARPLGWEVGGANPWIPSAQGRGHYYAGLGAKLPEYNFRNRSVIAFHADNLRHWLNRGLDGVHLSGVDRLVENGPQAWSDQPQSRDVVGYLGDQVRAYPGRHVVCDAPTAPQVHGDAAICGAALAHDLKGVLQRAVRNDPAAMRAALDYWRKAPRTMTVMSSSGGADKANASIMDDDWRAMTSTLQAMMPGTPWLQHGVDIDVTGATLQAQTSVQRDLNALRNSRPSVARGTLEQVQVQGSLSSFMRVLDGERTLVVTNSGNTRAEADIVGLPRRARLVPLHPKRTGSSFVAEVMLVDTGGRTTVAMPARSVRVFSVEAAPRS
jgi:alpha-amylase